MIPCRAVPERLLQTLIDDLVRFRSARQLLQVGLPEARFEMANVERRLLTSLALIECVRIDAPRTEIRQLEAKQREPLGFIHYQKESPTMLRRVYETPARVNAVRRNQPELGERSDGVIEIEQSGGKGSFKLNASAAQCCMFEGAGEVNLVLERKVQDGQAAHA